MTVNKVKVVNSHCIFGKYKKLLDVNNKNIVDKYGII